MFVFPLREIKFFPSHNSIFQLHPKSTLAARVNITFSSMRCIFLKPDLYWILRLSEGQLSYLTESQTQLGFQVKPPSPLCTQSMTRALISTRVLSYVSLGSFPRFYSFFILIQSFTPFPPAFLLWIKLTCTLWWIPLQKQPLLSCKEQFIAAYLIKTQWQCIFLHSLTSCVQGSILFWAFSFKDSPRV